jgi:hypothetical protein
MSHPYRDVVSRSMKQESDKSTPAHSKSRVWSWRAGTEVWTLLLSCGH